MAAPSAAAAAAVDDAMEIVDDTAAAVDSGEKPVVSAIRLSELVFVYGVEESAAAKETLKSQIMGEVRKHGSFERMDASRANGETAGADAGAVEHFLLAPLFVNGRS